nr:uncharacterized protein LOC120974819 [Aegilops tauschii subsp. strangulata]
MLAWEEFKNAGVVPCNERARFNNATREKVTFVANQRAYTVKCYKGHRKSAMYGRGWRKFYEDNNLGKGQMVVFYLDEPSPTASILWFQVGNGSEDEQPMEEGDPIEDSDFRKKWKDFAASRGLKVNTAVLIGFKSSERDDVHVLVILKKLG